MPVTTNEFFYLLAAIFHVQLLNYDIQCQMCFQAHCRLMLYDVLAKVAEWI